MDIPITNPSLNATAEDNSKLDESFTQSSTTVNLGSGATYNQNCGNERAHHVKIATVIEKSLQIFVVLAICFFFNILQHRLQRENEIIHHKMMSYAEQRYNELINRIEDERKFEAERYTQYSKDAQQVHKELLEQANAGTIWILRDDLIKTIDYHEASKLITNKEYKRIKDEFAYYKQIGGNHDVEDRFDHFTTKIYGTGEIKMVNGISSKYTSENK